VTDEQIEAFLARCGCTELEPQELKAITVRELSDIHRYLYARDDLRNPAFLNVMNTLSATYKSKASARPKRTDSFQKVLAKLGMTL
jgi:hypothetical protein